MSARSIALRLTVLSAAAMAQACASAPTPVETAMVTQGETAPILPASREERDAADRMDLLSQATFWGREYEKNPNDYETALKFARVLRVMGSSQRASEVSSQALTSKPGDVELTLVFAQASLDQGRPDLAVTPLARAEGPGQSDWRVMSIIGVVMDQMDRHTDAQAYFHKAMDLSPDNPKIISNLALSFLLADDPAKAEELLRAAVRLPGADARVTQNLILALGVQGKFEEVARVAGVETPTALVASNQEYFRALLTPSRRWDSLRGQQN
jgi:Flp pilus assembly protein TadD